MEENYIPNLPIAPKVIFAFQQGQLFNLKKAVQESRFDDAMEFIEDPEPEPLEPGNTDICPGWRPLFLLGTGGEGTARLYQNNSNNKQIIAVKTSIRNKQDRAKKDHIPIEIQILQHLSQWNHPNIITYLGHKLNTPTIGRDSLYLSYSNAGDLTNLKDDYSANRTPIPERLVWTIFSQLASALAFLHHGYGTNLYENGWKMILHRDVKPANIFLHFVGEVVEVRLADFGCSRFQDREEVMEGGTEYYSPPEAPLFSDKYDIWGVGASIYFLCTGEAPVELNIVDNDMDEDDMETKEKPLVRKALDVSLPPEFRGDLSDMGSADEGWEGRYSEELQRVLSASLALERDDRIGALELLRKIKAVDKV